MADTLCERFVELHLQKVSRMALNILAPEVLDARRVVEDLRHHIARRLVPFELHDYQVRFRVHGQKVERPTVHADLPTNNQQLLAEQTDVEAQPVLETFLFVESVWP